MQCRLLSQTSVVPAPKGDFKFEFADAEKRGSLCRVTLRPGPMAKSTETITLCSLLLAVGSGFAAPQLVWKTHMVQTTNHFRGLCVVDQNVVWASGTQGTFVRSTNGGGSWQLGKVPGAEALDFRDVEARDGQTAWLLSSGKGPQSRIYKTTDGGRRWTLQFQNEKPEAFFDAFAFWDDRHGIALSDPVDGRFLVIATTNGGTTWVPINGSMPVALLNESAFAASGTCLVVQGQSHVWFGTGGGAKARVFRSSDRGGSWSVSETPVKAGAESAGIFSLAFRDERNGVAAGGDYKKPEVTGRNLAFTHNGGETWHNREGKFPRGFRSAIGWVREENRWSLVTVGTSGSDFLKPAWPWRKLDNQNYNTLSVGRFDPEAIWAAGPKGRIARLSRLDRSAHTLPNLNGFMTLYESFYFGR